MMIPDSHQCISNERENNVGDAGSSHSVSRPSWEACMSPVDIFVAKKRKNTVKTNRSDLEHNLTLTPKQLRKMIRCSQ